MLEGHTGGVWGVCAVAVGGRTLLASAGDGTVRLWDPATGTTERVLEGHTVGVNGVCAVAVGGRTLLASASYDGTVRLWDPATGTAVLTIPVYHGALAVAAMVSTAPDLLAVGLDAGLLVIDVRSVATATYGRPTP